jgi:hypothetical protein
MCLGHQRLLALPHRPLDVRLLPGGACLRAGERGFGAARPVLVDI